MYGYVLMFILLRYLVLLEFLYFRPISDIKSNSFNVDNNFQILSG